MNNLPKWQAEYMLNALNNVKTAADLAEYVDLPGESDLGINFAQRALEERDKLGGFRTLEEIYNDEGNSNE